MSYPETKSSNVKITEALELLNEAAREKKDELKGLLNDRYSHIKQAMSTGTEQIIEKAKQFAEEGKERITDVASEADKRVRKNPWPYIAGAAAASLIVGYLMGKRK